MNEINNYSKKGLDKIRDVDILDSEDFSIIKIASKELQRSYEVKQVFRTETEMRFSVLNDVKFPTPASKYWQSIREQMVHYSNLIYLACEYDETQGKLELAECDLEDITGDTKRDNARKKIKNSEIKRLQFTLIEQRATAKDRVREIRLWEELKEELKKLGKFDINDVNAHQVESYKLRWSREAELGKLTGQPDMMKNGISQFATIDKAYPSIEDKSN